MYKLIIRPFLFLFPPERVHHMVVFCVKLLSLFPVFTYVIKWIYTVNNKALQTNFLGMHFKNRIGLAAGFDKNASFFNQFAAFGFSFIEIGTVTPRPQPGNPRPRSFRLPQDKALINRMGFNNLGADAAAKKLSGRRSKNLIIGGNIGKNTNTPNDEAVNDYLYCFSKLYHFVDYFVVNVSCPNISDLKELQDQHMLEGILSALVKKRQEHTLKKPILLKISPDLNTDQVDETISIIHKTGIDGIVAANTTVSRQQLTTQADTIKRIGNGGLSGLPIKSRTTALIQYIHNKTKGQMPIIGVGGIFSPSDAREKLNAGATLVQVYTGFIYEGPGLVKRILKNMSM